jgi:hypothetical protein
MRLISAERKAEYFSREIWTGVIELKTRLKFAFRRKRSRGRTVCEGGTTGDDANAFAPDRQIMTRRPTRLVGPVAIGPAGPFLFWA